jgi:LuxR family maltose regulon positive regulatory protein
MIIHIGPSPDAAVAERGWPRNLTRRQVADELSVSVSTVNTHVRNIYTRPQAGDRAVAVQRSRAPRMLSTRQTVR